MAIAAGPRSKFGERVLALAIPLIYGRRALTFSVLMALTLLFGWNALQLKPDAGFEKQIPLDHPYMKVFKQYQKEFGGANLLSIVLMRDDGAIAPSAGQANETDADGSGGVSHQIYDPDFLAKLRELTDATFFLPGVDRTRVSSLFTPDLVYLDVVEGGINLGNVIPRDFAPTPAMMQQVREHVAKAGIIGRYVSARQDGAMIVAELLERHPVTGEKLDYHRLANQLEDQLRGRIQNRTMYEYRLKADPKNSSAPYKAGDVVWRGYTDYGWRLRFQTFEAEQRDADGNAVLVKGKDVDVKAVPNPDYSPHYSVHIIGFAKVIGDVTDASIEVVGFFFIAILLMIGLLWLFCGSLRLSLLPLSAALTAVVWELGLLKLTGFGLDPFAILVPFLILSIGVSHGVQYINNWGNEVAENGRNAYAASVETFRLLFLPGTVAIITNVIGFATLMFIQIDIVREMALNAAMGMAAVIVTNKIMLPIALTWIHLKDPEKYRAAQKKRQQAGDGFWQRLAAITSRKWACLTLAISAGLLGWALTMYPYLIVGDSQVGVPELKPDGRYNTDSRLIASNFFIGVDLLKVIAQTKPYGCVDAKTMQSIDDFTWRMRNVPGVRSAIALPNLASEARGLLSEGSPKFKVLPRNSAMLSALVGRVPASVGLQNLDCSAMPVLIFTADHRAETLARVVRAAKAFEVQNVKENPDTAVHFALASGNAGIAAATNEEIRAREIIVIVWVHLTLLVFVWLSFRSWQSVVCIGTPLVLCSLLTYGFMATFGIGMKAATLPVAAFGVGIGVDDGIYLWGALLRYLGGGLTLRQSFHRALRASGKATLFTSLALIVSVGTWLFSGLQFQADMGLLLLFMFTTNLLGANLMMPALGWLCHAIAPLQAARTAAKVV
jgi:predicted RND superfamily exporter protein